MSALLSVGFIPTAALANDAALSDQETTVDAVVEIVIYLTTGNKVTYDQICQNPKLYEFDTTVANYFNQTIIPTFKLHN